MDSSVVISSASLLNSSQGRNPHRRSRSRGSSSKGPAAAGGALVDQSQEMQPHQHEARKSRLPDMERIMHPREGATAPLSPVPLSVEVWKQRAQKRGSLIKVRGCDDYCSCWKAAAFFFLWGWVLSGFSGTVDESLMSTRHFSP